ncbi:MAG: OsmC family protein [Saprospiraceae bacterium]|nr:OsmC family protein [Saprospiraceae bacterium]
MKKEHIFSIETTWNGDIGTGTSAYEAYSRDHTISLPGKIQSIEGSSAPEFRGDSNKYNPEELFISAFSSCHMLWYLHLCADAGIIVKEYKDQATGILKMQNNSEGQFSEIALHPIVRITDESKIELALQLHEKAHQYCFISNSCNFSVKIILSNDSVLAY